MKKKVSLKDIAKKVGVSTALVSYVLNNQKTGRIRKEVAHKIKETAKELHYRPNQIAKSLKLNKSFTIGVIVADISNPFFSNLARIIEDEASKNGYTVIFGSADENAAKSSKLMHALHDRLVDGFIIAPAENGEANIQYLIDQDIPFVLIDRFFPTINTNWILLDNYEASVTAIRHFIAGGSTKTALITYETSLCNLSERKRGYQDALLENNISPRQDWCIEIPFSADIGVEVGKSIDKMVADDIPIDSILFTSNLLAMHGLKHIHSKSLRVPDELSLITYDEMDAFDLFYAPLTCLKQPIEQMGQAATQHLLNLISNQNENAIKQELLAAELIVRQSTLPV